jgi:tRNA nucleotidyltransferase (CCA-adding enzyme)
MSDYMFMLESHLSTDQFRVVSEMQKVAANMGVSLYLTGGALRDMLGGFPVRGLGFTTEGSATKLAKMAEQKHGVEVVETDDHLKLANLKFPNGITCEVRMARAEKFAKSGAKPQVSPATIHEDLRSRDFTINAIGLSLNKASLGLLIDPTNGVGDIERKELRAIHNYSFYDEPARILRLIRFKIRLGYGIDERTKLQYENAREAEMLTKLTPEALLLELRGMANEVNIHDLMQALDEEKLTALYSPILTGPKLNLAGLSKLQKARQTPPFGWDLRMNGLPLLLAVLVEKLSSKEAAQIYKSVELPKGDINAIAKMEAGAKKLERDLKSPKLQKASLLYQLIMKSPGEQVLYLLVYSTQRIVPDRIRNFFQKHLPASMEVTDELVTATGVALGTPKFQRAKEEMILTRLDARPKKVEPPPEPPPPPPMSGFARSSSLRARS